MATETAVKTETLPGSFSGRPRQAFGIRGEGFGADKRGTATIGGVPLEIIKWSDDDIRGVLPGDAKPGTVVVTTADGVAIRVAEAKW